MQWRCKRDSPYVYLHDPLTLISTFDTSFCTFKDVWFNYDIIDGTFRTFEVDPGTKDSYKVSFAIDVDAKKVSSYVVSELLKFA